MSRQFNFPPPSYSAVYVGETPVSNVANGKAHESEGSAPVSPVSAASESRVSLFSCFHCALHNGIKAIRKDKHSAKSKSHLLTPFLNPVNHGQRKYNEAHIKTRNTIERQYGVLKRRFPVLAVGLRLKLDTAVNVIIACCILHNICILRKEQMPIDDYTIPNLEELIENGQINQAPNTISEPSYGFHRNNMSQYFETL